MLYVPYRYQSLKSLHKVRALRERERRHQPYQHRDLQHILQLSLPTSSGVCWYFSAYMVLLAIAPLLNAGIEKLPKGQYRLIITF